jgi:hypothetical protein
MRKCERCGKETPLFRKPGNRWCDICHAGIAMKRAYKAFHDVWWHGTSRESWIEIIKSGGLGARRGPGKSKMVYLAKRPEEAAQYGEVLLCVRYGPGSGIDNYAPGCWQMRVYSKIPLTNILEVPKGGKP